MIKTISRIDSIDLLRGIVLVLMLLDHTRIFFGNVSAPLSLVDPNVAAYFTRFITHFCAPVFIFLAGVSAYLSAQRPGSSIKSISYLLFTRGVWFILLEFTLMYFAWTFTLVPYSMEFAIFCAIGASMIALSLMVFLPLWLIAAISILLIVGHNILDPIMAASFGHWSWVWMLLHDGGKFSAFGLVDVIVYYPIIPWIGVIGLGYVLGQLFTLPENQRRKVLIAIGFTFTIAFILLRYGNIYGNPTPWVLQETALLNVMAFLNNEKYPPSLAYILMTIGPALIFLGAISERNCSAKISQMIITFGRVPFFFYVVHLIVILSLGLMSVYLLHGLDAIGHYSANTYKKPIEYGHSMSVVYAVALFALGLLYYPCSWYGRFKATHRKWYMGYL